MELTPLDYEILEFINQFDTVEKSKIINQFSSKIDAVEYRLELLLTPQYRNNLPNYIEEIYRHHKDVVGITHSDGTDTFRITFKGKTALQDYQLKKQIERIKNKKDTALRILPIIISGLSFLLSCYAIFIASK